LRFELYEYLNRFFSYLKRLSIKYLIFKSGPPRQLFLDEVKANLNFEIVNRFSSNSYIEHFNKANRFTEGHAFESRFLIDATDVKVDIKSGLIFDQLSTVVSESSSWPADRILLGSPYVPRIGALSIKNNIENIILPSNGYYHWLIEDLAPFLYCLRNSEKSAQVLYYHNAPSYVIDLIRELPNISVAMPRGVQIEKVRFVTRGPDTGWPLNEDVFELRNYFLESLQKVKSTKKIYISRQKTTRSPKFEASLVEILEKEGWNILFLEEMSLREQIVEFSSATIVCGVHGAGLSGIVWMDSKAKVIELSPTRHVPCFSRLSSIVGCEHELIVFESEIFDLDAAQVFELIQSKF
jgi:hypothetical protein